MTNREIDALVAEKVIGNDVFSIGGGSEMIQESKKDPQGRFLCSRNLANYSTDISMAWDVLEKVYPTAALSLIDNKFTVFDCRNNLPLAEANTAPMAICLAALKSVGVKV